MSEKRITLRTTDKLTSDLHLIARSQGNSSNELACEVLQAYIDTFDITTKVIPQPAIEQVVVTRKV